MDYTTILSALAEPGRLQIVELLRKGPLTVGKQQTIFIIRQSQASYNEAGMVGFDAETNRRIYKLRSKPQIYG